MIEHPRTTASCLASAPIRAWAACLRGMGVTALLAAAVFAQASEDPADVMDLFGAQAQVSPAAEPLAIDDYVVDPAFNDGRYLLDAFQTNQTEPNRNFVGRKVARMSNGDILVAGLVKNPVGNQTNGLWNVALTRYDSTGTVRKTWFNAGAYSHAGSEYIIYPKVYNASFSWIQDLKIVGNFILVSTNYIYGGGTTDIDTRILVFDTDGVFRGWKGAFSQDSAADHIGGMEVYTTGTGLALTTHVVVVGTHIAPGALPRPVFQRFMLDGNGSLHDQTGVVPLNVAACAHTSVGCEAKGIALGHNMFIGTAPSIFVANARRIGTSGRKAIAVMKINQNGVADSSWASIAWNTSPVSGGDNVPFGIAVVSTGVGLPASPRVHTVYVASQIDRACKPGISVLRMSTSDNGDTAFTTGFGGSDATNPISCILNTSHLGSGLAMQGGKLAITGAAVWTPLCTGGPCEDRVTGMLAVLDGLALKSFRSYPYEAGDGRARHTDLWGIAGGGGASFIAVGDARFFNDNSVPANLRGKQSMATVRFVPDDRIFQNGFD